MSGLTEQKLIIIPYPHKRIISVAILLIMIVYGLIPAFAAAVEIHTNGLESKARTGFEYTQNHQTANTRASQISWSGVVVLDEDYTVPSGVTLYVGAGSKIYSKKDVAIYIEGTMKIDGQIEAPVTFNSLEQNDLWRGIQFNESSNSLDSYINFCSISDAGTALTFKGGSFNLNHITFDNNHIGLNVNLASGRISHSEFVSNDVAFISDSSIAVLDNTTIENSAGFDVIMRNGTSVTLINTTFDSSRIAVDDIYSLMEVFWHLKISIIDPKHSSSFSTNLAVIDAFGSEVHSNIIGLSDSSRWLKCKSFELMAKPDEPAKIKTTYFTSHLLQLIRFGITRTEIVYLDSIKHIVVDWSDRDSSIPTLAGLASSDSQNAFLRDLQNIGWKHTIRAEKQTTLDYLANRMSNLGRYSIEYDNHTHLNYGLDNGSTVDLQLSNLVCTLPGRSAQPGNYLVISAHYDTDHNQNVVGADDDGSGVAAMLEIARLIGYLEFNTTIKFIFFDGEEEGYIGSYDYVKAESDAGSNIISDINLDMIGYNQDSGYPCIIRTNTESIGIAQLFSDLNTNMALGLDVTIVNDASYRRSDYFNFWDFGYRAVDFVEAEEVETWNLYYHTSSDTHDKINFSYLSKMTGLALAGLVDLAEIFNSPPSQTGDLKPASTHLTRPTITWRPSMDVNGGPLSYNLEVFDTGPDVPGGPQKIIDLMLGDNYYTFTKELKFGRTYSIHLSARDDKLTSSGTYMTELTVINTPPVLTEIPSQNLTQGKSWELQVFSTDIDEPPDSLEYYVNTTMFELNRTTGLVNWTPTKHDVGEHIINFSVRDGNSGLDFQMVIIDVANVNDAPEILYTPRGFIMDEDTVLYHALDLNDVFIDFDGDELEYTAGGFETINLTINDNGSIDIRGMPDWYGDELIKITAVDPFGLFISTIIEVIVLPVNDAPVLHHIDDIVIYENDTMVLDPVISDIDSTLIEQHSSWFNFTGTWQTDYFSAGMYKMNISVNDGEAMDWQWFNITVINVNRLPEKKFLTTLVSPIIAGTQYNLRSEFLDPDDDINGNGLLDDSEIDNQTYLWDFGDGSKKTGDSVTHTYKKPGAYIIVMTVTDGDNESVEFRLKFSVDEKSSTMNMKMRLLLIGALGMILLGSILIYTSLIRKRTGLREEPETEKAVDDKTTDDKDMSAKRPVKRIKKGEKINTSPDDLKEVSQESSDENN